MNLPKPIRLRTLIVIGMLFFILLSSCNSTNKETADTVYKNGKIYTVNDRNPWAEAVAIKDGKFIKVGSDSDVDKLIGDSTVVIDLGGKFVMPGIHDLHCHPAFVYTYEIDGQLVFPNSYNKDEIRTALKIYSVSHPEKSWIRGKQWAHALFTNGKMTKEFIDAVVPDRPVMLVAESGHNVTCNSKALAIAGINRNTPDPPGGVIDRDSKTGEPTGYLSEEAVGLVGKYIPLPSDSSYYKGLTKALDEMRQVGLTSIVDAKTARGALIAYRKLEDEGKLNMRVQATLPVHDYAVSVITDEDAVKLINERKNFQSHLVNTNSVKVVADGTPMSFTSLMLEPYTNNPNTRGETAIGIDSIHLGQLLEFHKAGIQLHFHAHGDGTIHEVLNIIERFQKDYPRPGLHHHIAHTSMVIASDIQRFKDLGVYADFSSPYWVPGDFATMGVKMFGQERMDKEFYPIKEFIEAGVVFGYGTDWPIPFPVISPWPNLESLVTRKDPYGKKPGQVGEPITLTQAIKMMTLSGAQVVMQDKVSGSIEEGKYADMIVLDRNLFEIPAENIDGTIVLNTIFEGKSVFKK